MSERMNLTASEVRLIQAVRLATSPAPSKPATYTCNTVGCYKYGHTFTEAGWNGTATAKGHVDTAAKIGITHA